MSQNHPPVKNPTEILFEKKVRNHKKNIRTCPKRNSMTLLPKVAASGTKPETRPLGSVSLSFQTRPIERPLGSEILSSGSVSLSFLS
ncbi:hypothetical protein LEP1GSC005_3667 [Leptospira santarosai str. ST188]|nr:hypothetical protein LEP1GSC005_3667 [Leptospira santarosai str. ST188]